MIDTQSVKQSVNLLELAEHYTILRKVTARGEHAGPCPRCGGEDRFHVSTDWFFCRQCHAKRGDAIEFVQWINGVGFQEAVAMLNGGISIPATRTRQREATHRPQPAQTSSWIKQATDLVDRARERLCGGDSEPATSYLRRRKIESYVWLTYGLGYVPRAPTAEQSPAIVLPWYRQGEVVAVRFRFIEDQEGPKIKSLKGSRFAGLVYGGQAISGAGEQFRTLVLCEGELNALSIWQVANETRIDVLSLGSESQQLTPAMVAYAQRYGHVITWFDKPEIAVSVANALPGATAVNSPLIDGKANDANDLLQIERLGGFLSYARLRACRNRQEKENLLWDLWDAAASLHGVDGGTAQVIERLADEMGRQARVIEAEPNRWISHELDQNAEEEVA